MISKILRRVRERGITNAWHVAKSRLYERYREWWLGIQTAVPHDTDTRNFGDDNHPYCPMCYTAIDAALANAPIEPGVSSFLDYGSGKGRIIAEAATRPFQRVIGVEFAMDLCDASEQNIRRAQPRLKCNNVYTVLGDAAQYVVPDDVTHVTLFNPFSGKVLEEVEERLITSLQRAPREMHVFYMFPHEVQEDYFADSHWLKFNGELTTGYWEGVTFRHYTSVTYAPESRPNGELLTV